MTMDSTLVVRANVTAEIREASTGRLIDTIRRHNLVTLAGRNMIRDMLNLAAPNPLVRFALGTGSTAPAAGDVAMEALEFTGLITNRAATDGVLTVQYFLGGASANGVTLTEAGLIAQDGTLFARVTFPGIIKSSTLTVTFTWEVTLGAS